MNFVAGFLLLMSGGNEEESFHFLVNLLTTSKEVPEMSGLRGLYKTGFPLLAKYSAIFDKAFAKELSSVHGHFTEAGIPPLLWLTKWIQTLSLYSFSFATCIRVWDYILSTGSMYILKFALAVIESLEEKLLAMDLIGINDCLNSLSQTRIEERLLARACIFDLY